uniref:Uncharacterized protein n=1 Tax=Rhizophora mucronata TaxID=61149 RepID=A0A2P2Q5N1_RHIMU
MSMIVPELLNSHKCFTHATKREKQMWEPKKAT